MNKTLIVIVGPTGIGKSDTAIEIAQRLSAEVISADSRQLYKGIPIVTAAPTQKDFDKVRHHLVGTLNLQDYYSASQFEEDALRIIRQLHKKNDCAVMCGGSMMYVDAVCSGIDNIPTIPDDIRFGLIEEYNEKGDEWLLHELLRLDSTYYNQVDLKNRKRVIHAIEICRTAGVPYSELRQGVKKSRDFRIIKIGLTASREYIFNRINKRTYKMLEQGMIDEARSVYHLRHLNSLNTVGFKELFAYFDEKWDLDTAIARIQKNTRVYAKKQMTWFKRDTEIEWFDVESMGTDLINQIMQYVVNCGNGFDMRNLV